MREEAIAASRLDLEREQQKHRAPDERARSELCAYLWTRRAEIERVARARVCAVSDPAEIADPEYAADLRAAVSAALDFGIATVEKGGDRLPPLPTPLLAQARSDARNGVSLETVVRRYFAGYAVLGDFLVEGAETTGLPRRSFVKGVLGTRATLFDELIAVISEEYAREVDDRPGTAERRRAERVRRLLAGDRLDPSALAYDFGLCHLGAIAQGAGAALEVHRLGASLDCRLLAVCPGGETVWFWLGSRQGVDPEGLQQQVLPAVWPAHLLLGLGEPAQGFDGWRLTHRQARAALSVAADSHRPVVRYPDVALLASTLQDDLLVTSLRHIYLEPLEGERDGGRVLRETLRAYFAADRNLSSAAALLGVSRNTVTNRLHTIEGRLRRTVSSCAAELEAALRLEEMAGHR